MHIVSNATGPPATTENKALIWRGAHSQPKSRWHTRNRCVLLPPAACNPFLMDPFVSICVETLIPSTCFALDALSCPVRFLTRPVTVICHLYWPKPLSKITRTTMYMFFRQRLQLRY